MADIHVEPQKKPTSPSTMWIWILLGLIILAVVAYLVFIRQEPNQSVTPDTSPTTFVPYVRATLHALLT